jgi:hypothetical protein
VTKVGLVAEAAGVAGATVVVVGAAEILKVMVAVAVPALAPVAVIVILAEDAAEGVPETTPVDAFKVRPAGSDPEVTAKVTAPVKLFVVNEVEELIAVPAVPEIV